MQLGLSSEAAYGASLDDLVATCARRGLAALELTLTNQVTADQLFRYFDADAAVRLSGLMSDDASAERRLATLSRDVGAPIIVRSPDRHAGIRHVLNIIEYGGTALLLVKGPAPVWLDSVTAAGIGFAWQVDESNPDPAGDAELIMRRVQHIEYVRLAGGGPETMMQEGRGIAGLMRTLALAGYNGPLILTPTSQRFRLAWSAWLGRRGGWGCGSKANHEDNQTVLHGK